MNITLFTLTFFILSTDACIYAGGEDYLCTPHTIDIQSPLSTTTIGFVVPTIPTYIENTQAHPSPSTNPNSPFIFPTRAIPFGQTSVTSFPPETEDRQVRALLKEITEGPPQDDTYAYRFPSSSKPKIVRERHIIEGRILSRIFHPCVCCILCCYEPIAIIEEEMI